VLDNFWIQLGIVCAVAVAAWVWAFNTDAPGCNDDCGQGDKPCKCGRKE